ncbi:hypothetical protein GCK72_001792 [Caenorhabditis remanei]|nr:hypothetical protein GCK72_001792 [Caenorhabditis remanei]KAF1769975.1 hypothetical protein GCK72_001792 [Caenorhabditis remanei]
MVHAVQGFGIPKKIVDIRHAVTHQTCPDISELRYATNFCLEWLWDNFWLSDASNAMNSGKAGTSNSSKSGSSAEYGNQRGREQQHVASIRAFNTWRGKNRLLKTELEFSEVSEIYAIKQHVLLDYVGFLSCLVRDGHLIQTGGQWKNWKLPPTSSDEKWIVPEPITKFWEPIFHLMFSLKLGPELVISLMWRLREPTIKQISKDQITAYVRLIIQNFADNDVFSPDAWVRILDHLLPVAKYFSKEIIDIVMRNCPNLSRKRRKQIHQILTIATVKSANLTNSDGPSGSATSSSDGSKVHTVNDLLQLLKSRTKSTESSTNSRNEKTGIELCESEEWVDVPFGMAPGQRVETFTVVIDETSVSRRKRKAFDPAITLDDE